MNATNWNCKFIDGLFYHWNRTRSGLGFCTATEDGPPFYPNVEILYRLDVEARRTV